MAPARDVPKHQSLGLFYKLFFNVSEFNVPPPGPPARIGKQAQML